MGLGPAIIGGIVGAAIGILIQVAFEVGGNIQAPWGAIIIGALTGLGVRLATAKLPSPSYARGALALLLGLGAIFASPYAVQRAIARKAEAQKLALSTIKSGKAASKENGQDSADAKDSGVPEAEREDLPGAVPVHGAGGNKLAVRPKGNDLWQFIYMAVGALLAYEFGRGADKKVIGESVETPVEPPAAFDPSN